MNCLDESGNDSRVVIPDIFLLKTPTVLYLSSKVFLCINDEFESLDKIELNWIKLENRNKNLNLYLTADGTSFIALKSQGSETNQKRKMYLAGEVIKISAGYSHAACLLRDGRVFAWGSFRVSSNFVLYNSSRLIN